MDPFTYVASKKQLRLVAIMLLLWGLNASALACAPQGSSSDVEAFFVREGKRSPRFRLEVASSDKARQLGLMYRKALSDDRGMIFIFPESEHHSFWMKNTYISLDMVFVGSDMQVVGILKEVPPLNEIPRSVDRESRYVVELAAGTTTRQGIEEGDTLQVVGSLPQAEGSYRYDGRQALR